MEEKYIPYGEEWKNEIKKLTKDQLIEFLKATLLSRNKLEYMVENGLGYEDLKDDTTS